MTHQVTNPVHSSDRGIPELPRRRRTATDKAFSSTKLAAVPHLFQAAILFGNVRPRFSTSRRNRRCSVLERSMIVPSLENSIRVKSRMKPFNSIRSCFTGTERRSWAFTLARSTAQGERLGNIIICPSFQTGNFIQFQIISRKQNSRCGGAILSQCSQQFQPTAVWQVNIKINKSKTTPSQNLDCLETCAAMCDGTVWCFKVPYKYHAPALHRLLKQNFDSLLCSPFLCSAIDRLYSIFRKQPNTGPFSLAPGIRPSTQ